MKRTGFDLFGDDLNVSRLFLSLATAVAFAESAKNMK
jgi:hypothetical protein